MRQLIIFLSVFLYGYTASAQTESDIIKRRTQSIQQLIQTQVDCWNQGDLEGYMNGYWKSDSLQFVTEKGITFGYDNVLRNYQNTWGVKQDFGTLIFKDLRIKALDELKLLFQVTGKWFVISETEENGGHFSLIVRFENRVPQIIIDHTF